MVNPQLVQKWSFDLEHSKKATGFRYMYWPDDKWKSFSLCHTNIQPCRCSYVLSYLIIGFFIWDVSVTHVKRSQKLMTKIWSAFHFNICWLLYGWTGNRLYKKELWMYRHAWIFTFQSYVAFEMIMRCNVFFLFYFRCSLAYVANCLLLLLLGLVSACSYSPTVRPSVHAWCAV